MIDWMMVAAVTAILVAVSGLFLWVLRTILQPIKQLIRENTKAVEKVVEKLDNHEERLQTVEKEVAVLLDREDR